MRRDREDPIEDYREWADHRYDPGYWTPVGKGFWSRIQTIRREQRKRPESRVPLWLMLGSFACALVAPTEPRVAAGLAVGLTVAGFVLLWRKDRGRR